MATSSHRAKLRVLYDYTYTTADGVAVSFSAGEELILLRRTTDEWWFVGRHGNSGPVYVPANYVTEVGGGGVGGGGTGGGGRPPKPPPKPLVVEAVLRSLDDFLEHALDGDDDGGDEGGEGEGGEGEGVEGEGTDANANKLQKEEAEKGGEEGEDAAEEGRTPVTPYEEPLYENTADLHQLAQAHHQESPLVPNEARETADERDIRRSQSTQSNGSRSSSMGRSTDAPQSAEVTTPTSEVFTFNVNGHQKSDDSSASLEWTLNDDSPAVAAAATSDPTPTSDPGAQAVGKVKRKAPTPPKQKTLAVTEKRGMLNRTRIADNGKKVKKNWCQSYTVLNESGLYFYKDPKAASPKATAPNGKPDISIELSGTTIESVAKGMTSRKNVLQVSTQSGSQYLLQHDNSVMIQEWHALLERCAVPPAAARRADSSEALSSSPPTNGSDLLKSGKRPKKPGTPTAGGIEGSTVPLDESRRQRWDWLANWFKRRPGLESLREKGIIRDGVFGSHLLQLCATEDTTVPSFVRRCIAAIEERGLETDGIYRVSGNIAQIQKLRFQVDKDDSYDLTGEEFDIHDLAGALKLFFRELQEPLVPFAFFDKFVLASRNPLLGVKLKAFKSLISVLPDPNRETMKFLFEHFDRVVALNAQNRMQIQNVAIVFGPTLLWPDVCVDNVAVTMVLQSQVIDFILTERRHLF